MTVGKICPYCDKNPITLTDAEFAALIEEHDMTDLQALVAGVLCSACLPSYLEWLQEPVL